MTIDWKKEVESRKEDLLKDLFDLYVLIVFVMIQSK